MPTKIQERAIELFSTAYKFMPVLYERVLDFITTQPTEEERIAAVEAAMLFCRTPDRDDAKVEDRPKFRLSSYERAQLKLTELVRDTAFDYCAMFHDGLPAKEVATRVLTQINMLEEHGRLVQTAYIEGLICNDKHVPYGDVPKLKAFTAEELVAVMKNNPMLLAEFLCVGRKDPETLVAWMSQKLRGCDDELTRQGLIATFLAFNRDDNPRVEMNIIQVPRELMDLASIFSEGIPRV